MSAPPNAKTDRGLVLLGCGGHARSVAAVALSVGFERLLFTDANAKPDEFLLGLPVQAQLPDPAEGWLYLPCAGNNRARQAQLESLLAAGYALGSVISPRASIDRGATIGAACFIGHHAHLGPLATLGGGCILNTGAVVEHDCIVGDCAHVSVNSCVAGRGRLGDRVFLGAGAVVIDGVSIVNDVTIGAGAVVITDIDRPGVYVGVPARRIESR